VENDAYAIPGDPYAIPTGYTQSDHRVKFGEEWRPAEEPTRSELIGYYTAHANSRDDLAITAGRDYEVFGRVGIESREISKAVIVYEAEMIDGNTVIQAEKLNREQVEEMVNSGQIKIAAGLSVASLASREESLMARSGTVDALARDWHNIQSRAVAETTRPVAISGKSLVVEVSRDAPFGARDMSKALDALGREDVTEVAVRVVDRSAKVSLSR
jgi:hypothetical protein